MRNKKGITLLALAITIILLLILAGVVLNLTLGENGIIQKALLAKREYVNASENEQKQLENLYSEMKIATNGDITVNIEDLNKIIDNRILKSYPIGSIYISTQATNPSEFLGGTWESYGQGRTLVGAGTSDKTFTAGETGGESTHTLTIAEMPRHTHSWKGYYYNIFDTSGAMTLGSEQGTHWGDQETTPTGDSQAHNNLQPYIVTYMWKRVS